MSTVDERRTIRRARIVHDVEFELVHIIALVAAVLFGVLIVLPALIDLAASAPP